MTFESRIFRVFISSTFKDMELERNYLQNNAFIDLNNLCLSYGYRFQAVDLRWGVPTESTIDQNSVEICLKEITRCKRSGLKPNFLVLLGERYGWIPLPSKIPKDEFEILGSSKKITEQEQKLLKFWYKLDENAIINLENTSKYGIYILMPRKGGNYEKYADIKMWNEEEKNLKKILLNVKKETGFSITHQEIIKGIFEEKDSESYVHCFFRTINKLPQGVDKSLFFTNDTVEKSLLNDLKHKLKERLSNNIHEFVEIDLSDKNSTNNYLKELNSKVFESLKKSIINSISKEIQSPDEIEQENNYHIRFAKERIRIFEGRKEILTKINDYIMSEENKPFIISGEPGSGKTALLSKAFDQIRENQINLKKMIRFVGINRNSSTSISLLGNLCLTLMNYSNITEQKIPREYNKLVVIFLDALDQFPKIQPDKKVVIFLDALDQFPKMDKGRDLEWLPTILPKNIKIIISYATDDLDLKSLLKKKYTYFLQPLSGLAEDEGREILQQLLREKNRILQPSQEKEVLNKFNIEKSPLFLKFASEFVGKWRSFYPPDQTKLPSTTSEMIEIYLDMLSKNHISGIIECTLGYLATARNGLTETELLEVIAEDDEFWDNYFQPYLNKIEHKLPQKILPLIIWTRIYYDLEPFLIEKGIDNTITIDFFHRQFTKAVQDKYLPKEVETKKHFLLANYFHKKPHFYQMDEKKISNIRKASELPYHLRKSNKWSELENLFGDIQFLDAKCKSGLIEDLLHDFSRSLVLGKQHFKDISSIEKANKIILNEAHNIRKDPTIFIQQILNQPNNSKIFKAAKKFIDSKNIFYPWIEWITKPQEENALLLTLEDHEGSVNDAKFSPDGTKIISASDKLKLWNAETGEFIRDFKVDRWSFRNCQFSSDGSKIISCSETGTIIVWDVTSGEIDKKLMVKEFLNSKPIIFSPEVSKPGESKYNYASFDLLAKKLMLWDINTGENLQIQTNHQFQLESCDLSPNGDIIVTCSRDKTLSIWNVKTINLINTLAGQSGWVMDCKFSPDGSKIISASYDKTLELWDVATGKLIRTFIGHSDVVTSCDFSSDNSMIVSGSDDSTIKLWDSKTGKLLHTYEGHTRGISTCAFSPDDSKIVSSSKDGNLKVWKVGSFSGVKKLRGHSLPVICCEISSDGTKFISNCRDNDLKIWNLKKLINTFQNHTKNIENEQFFKILKGHKSIVMRCSFSTEGDKIVSASQDQTLIVWDSKTGKPLKTFEDNSDIINSCVFSPDGNRIASTTENKFENNHTLKIWNIKSGKILLSLEGHEEWINICEFSLDGARILSCDDHSLILWDTKKGVLIKKISDHFGVNRAKFSPNGQFIFYANDFDSNYSKINILDSESGIPLKTFNVPWSIGYWEFSKDGSKIVSGSNGHERPHLKVWNANSGELIQEFNITEEINSCSFSPDASMIVSVAIESKLNIWDVKTGNLIYTFGEFKDGINLCAFSPDGSKIISSGGWNDYTIKIWKINSELLNTLEGHSAIVNSCKFSPDGEKIVSCSDDKTVIVWDVDSGKILHTLEGHINDVECCSFSHDGKKIVSGSKEKILRVWDSSSGELIRIYGGPFRENDCKFSSDGSQIITTNGNTWKIWDSFTGELKKIFTGLGSVTSVSYDGSKILSTSSNGKNLQLWDSNSGNLLNIYKGHIGNIHSCTFSRDNSQICTVSKDNDMCTLWDIKKGNIVARFPLLGGGTSISAWNKGLIIVGDEGGNIYVLKFHTL